MTIECYTEDGADRKEPVNWNERKSRLLLVMGVLFALVVIAVIATFVGLMLRNSNTESAPIEEAMQLVYNVTLEGAALRGFVSLLTSLPTNVSFSFDDTVIRHYIFFQFEAKIPLPESLESLEICFTNNVFLFQEGRRQMNTTATTTSTTNFPGETFQPFLSVCFPWMGSHSTLQLQQQRPQHVAVVSSFRDYGAVVLVGNHNTNPLASSSQSMDGVVAYALYDGSLQRSHHPTFRTPMNRTTNDYDIRGVIQLRGRIGRDTTSSSNTMTLPVWRDEMILYFDGFYMEPQPPALFLYLTKRPNYWRYDNNDLFIPMEDDRAILMGLPEGSFAVHGSHMMRWPYPNVQWDDYVNGSWYLWCDAFTIVLAGGRLTGAQT